MDLNRLFAQTLNANYVQLEENAASYAAKRVGKTLYLFFEKSNGIVDWKNNLDFPAKPYHEMQDLWYVHRGFLRVFQSIKPRIKTLLAEGGIGRIIISGYSHGAALALLCHEFCVFNRPDLAEYIYGFGFGCPRVVWGRLNRRIRARFRNFTVVRNCSDLVTHVPPWIFGYRHVGRVLHIGRGGGYGPISSHRAESYLAEI